MQLSRAIHPRFPFGSVSEILNLAAYNNSPDRSTKSTTSRLDALCVLVNTEFQVLFHSPPGVLFTFPSQYFSTIGHWVVFRLGGWSPRLRCGFHVSASTPDTAGRLRISLHILDYHRLWSHFPKCSVHDLHTMSRSYNPSHALRRHWFGLFPVRSPLLGESFIYFLFLQVLRCFSSLR